MIAFEILEMIEKEKDITASELLSNLANKYRLKRRDRALIKELVFGVLRNRLLLDYIIEKHIKHKKPIQPPLQQILRIGAYQLLLLDRIPAHAAVNEAALCARTLFNKGAAGFVNAILRKISALTLEDIPLPDEKRDLTCFLSVQYSHPKWIVEILLEQFGVEKTREILAFNNKPAPLTLRVNITKISREQLIEWLQTTEPGADIKPGKISPQSIHIKNFPLKPSWTPLEKGWVYIQDEGAQLVSLVAHPREKMRIVDFCSAPGGKITHMAEMVSQNAELIALDISEVRLKKVGNNSKRLGLTKIRIAKITPGILEELSQKPAHLVLADVPCSGLGIIRRQPDIKWKKTKKEIKALPRLQLNILEQASRLVAPDGILIYSTCTLADIENSGVVNTFLKKHPEFEKGKIELSGSLADAPFITPEGFLLTLPPRDLTDGFFCAKLVKKYR